MKKIIVFALLLVPFTLLKAQSDKSALLQDLEKGQVAMQTGNQTATLKSSSRLFGAKDDLTTVIMIIPAGSTVALLASDSTYFKVNFEENEGYIFRRHALIDKAPASNRQTVQNQPRQQVQESQAPAEKEVSRFSYLENKYGTSMAARLNSGKIWKGMNSEMVQDSWGTALKINRVVSGNIIKEEWIFNNTWLYFENNTLMEWGPISR